MVAASDGRDRSGERERMIADQLHGRGIRSVTVLDAMRRIPREQFVPDVCVGEAYADSALAIDCGQTISQPYMVARMTELLELQAHSRVLEIGTGSGYQTAVLATLAGHVYTIEWHADLMNRAAARLAALGLTNVTYRCGDGSMGWPEYAPFEAIIVTAGAPEIPPALVGQLAPSGRLVVPVGGPSVQTLVRVVQTADGPRRDEIFQCRFVKLLGAAGWRE
jgi:protein-L-isoaspartate(D-aspartate) O-methyltransferase